MMFVAFVFVAVVGKREKRRRRGARSERECNARIESESRRHNNLSP